MLYCQWRHQADWLPRLVAQLLQQKTITQWNPLFSALYPTLKPFHHRTERSFPLRTLSGRCQDQPLFAFAIEVFVAIVGRFHKTIDVATVKSTTNKLVADDSAFLRLLHQGVSDLNFPITTGRC